MRQEREQKKGYKQNTLILRPLLLTNEGIRSYLGGRFLVRFWLRKNEHVFSPQSTRSNAEKRKAFKICHAERSRSICFKTLQLCLG